MVHHDRRNKVTIITLNRVALGVAAALTIGLAGTASAQVTTDTTVKTTTRSKTTVTSTRRIPVRKDGTTSSEAAGSIAQPNADSLRADSIANAERMRLASIAAVERARQDSIANAERMRQDSIAAVERARQDSIARERARQDSIAAAEAERIRQLSKGDVYFRLGAGAAVPNGDFGDVVKTGFNVTGSVGWHKWNSPIGLRADVGYDRFSFKSGFTGTNPNIWSGLGEVTLKIPQVMAVSPYAVAGGGFYRFNDDGTGSSTTKGGWNAGGGITFGMGAAKLFLESRYMHVNTPGKATTYYPVILGFSF
jgi:hypothetical protein